MRRQYLIRLDDACPTMDKTKWYHMGEILDKYGIKPLVGVIPHNEDPQQACNSLDDEFWERIRNWERCGWSIALHGYNHCYTSKEGKKGLNPMWDRSEFAGLPLEEQREKIRLGVSLMRENGINPKYFFAPSHTFDEATLIALKEESDIRVISDTIGRIPYQYKGFYFIPQVIGHCVRVPVPGIYTFCYHPNTMTDSSFESLDSFLRQNKKKFISIADIDLALYGGKKAIDKLISRAFFLYRKVKRLR